MEGVARAAEEDVSPAALVAARELFREATEDVDAGRFEVALEKFKRVAAVKETAAVRFNIGRCEESLGRSGTALADFELAEREAKGDAKGGDEIARLAHEHAATVRPKVPRLTLVVSPHPPEGLSVSLDGGRLSPGTLGVPLPLDPGPHTVDATAPGRPPFHAQVELQPGDTKRVALALGDASPVEEPEVPPGNGRRTAGYVAMGGGVALGAAAVVFLVVHNSAVNDLNQACPDAKCAGITRNSTQANDLRDTQSRARLDQALAIGFGAASVVALGVGAYLVLSKPASAPAPSAWIAPSAPGAPAGLSFHATF
jgi:hypothetical protein